MWTVLVQRALSRRIKNQRKFQLFKKKASYLKRVQSQDLVSQFGKSDTLCLKETSCLFTIILMSTNRPTQRSKHLQARQSTYAKLPVWPFITVVMRR